MLSRPTSIYPCNGRERTIKPYMVQDGYHEWLENEGTEKEILVRGKPKYKWIITKFNLDHKCVDRERDSKCQGCGHRQCVQSSGG